MPGSPLSELVAVDELSNAVAAVGLKLVHTDDPGAPDANMALLLPDSRRLPIDVRTTALLTARGLRDQLKLWDRQLQRDTVGVVVAKRITGDAREELRTAGWSWLDTRGHLRLSAAGLLVDTDVPATPRATTRREPFGGRVGIELAAAILLNPDHRVAIRPLATQIGRAPSSVSDAVTAFRDAGLITSAGIPRIPELFWEFAARWKPAEFAVADEPHGEVVLKALRVNIDDLHTPGWALGDSRAAAAYGAPIAIKSNHPSVLYLPDQQTMRRATKLLTPARENTTPVAVLRVAPTPLVCVHRQDPAAFPGNGNSESWPLTRPLFVALDLAQDPGRGREILEGWTPPEPWSRVW